MKLCKTIPVMLTLLFALLVIPRCEKLKEGVEDDNTSVETTDATDDTTPSESTPVITHTSKGGMPTVEEVETISTTSETEVKSASGDLLNMSGALSLNLLGNSASLVKNEGDGGCPPEAGIFCVTTMFAMIFDMSTGPANCNFKLLLKDPDGNDRTPRKVEGEEIYFIDGFGTIGIGDQGTVTCPESKAVVDWAKKVGLMKGGTIQKPSDNDDTFYPPTRLVMFKKPDGKFSWKIVFFPSDFVDEIVKRVPFLKRIKDTALDFVAYHGTHQRGEETGKGKGDVTLDWDELQRMMTMFQTWDDSSSGSDRDDGGMPVGNIKIDYDMTDDPTYYAMHFSKEFSMGDGNLPFVEDVPVTVYKSAGENYLHFATTEMPSGDDEEESSLVASEEDEGPIGNVQYCIKTNDSDEGLFKEVKASSITASQYVKDHEVHFQLIWKDLPEGTIIPDDYEMSIYAIGGPYIYGDVDMRVGRKGGEPFNGYRVNVPKCAALDADAMTGFNDMMTTHIGHAVDIFDDDGFFIMGLDKFGAGASPVWTTQEEIMKGFPTFTKFQIVEVASSSASPVITE